MNKDFQDRIDDFVLDRMPDADKKLFIEETNQDDAKKNQLAFTQKVQSAIKSRSEKLALIEQFEEKSENESKIRRHNIIIKLSGTIGMAAMFIIGLYLFVPKDDITSNLVADISPVDVIYNSMEMNQIVALINNKEYEDALFLIGKVEDNLKIESEKVSFSMGKEVHGYSTSNNASKQNDDSRKPISIEEQKSLLLWMKANSLIGLNRIQEAIAVLSELRNQNSEYKERADSLYNMIQNR